MEKSYLIVRTHPNGLVNGRSILIKMNGLIFCVIAVLMFIPVQGDDEEQVEQLMESVGIEEEEGSLMCFRCELGFWDACYTTDMNCSLGERCYTGRGKAASLDIKTLGCVKAEECGVERTFELFSNQTIFVMTKYCCNTPFCNSAHSFTSITLLYFTMSVLATWHLTEASTR